MPLRKARIWIHWSLTDNWTPVHFVLFLNRIESLPGDRFGNGEEEKTEDWAGVRGRKEGIHTYCISVARGRGWGL